MGAKEQEAKRRNKSQPHPLPWSREAWEQPGLWGGEALAGGLLP